MIHQSFWHESTCLVCITSLVLKVSRQDIGRPKRYVGEAVDREQCLGQNQMETTLYKRTNYHLVTHRLRNTVCRLFFKYKIDNNRRAIESCVPHTGRSVTLDLDIYQTLCCISTSALFHHCRLPYHMETSDDANNIYVNRQFY